MENARQFIYRLKFVRISLPKRMMRKSEKILEDIDKLKKYYTKFRPDIDTRAFYSKMRIQRKWHDRYIDIVTENLDLKGKKILDVGCGSGPVDFEILSRVDADITGIDFNEEAIEFANKRKKELKVKNAKFLAAKCESLPFKDKSFDTLICLETLEHLIKPGLAIQEFRRVLKPRGKLLVTTPNYASVWPVIEWFWDRFGRGRDYAHVHITKFTPSSLSRELKGNGFMVTKLFTTHNIAPFFHLVTDWHPHWIENLLMRRRLGMILVATATVQKL